MKPYGAGLARRHWSDGLRARARETLEVRVDHHFDELFEGHARRPYGSVSSTFASISRLKGTLSVHFLTLSWLKQSLFALFRTFGVRTVTLDLRTCPFQP